MTVNDTLKRLHDAGVSIWLDSSRASCSRAASSPS